MEQNKIDYMIAYAVDKMTQFLVEDYAMSIPQALRSIYSSKTYHALLRTETGLYIQSPSYCYELLEKELSLSK